MHSQPGKFDFKKTAKKLKQYCCVEKSATFWKLITCTGTIIHEFIHAFGFYHEHARPDRDPYVNIFWENIQDDPDRSSQFAIATGTYTFDVEYDGRSVMHYGSTAFSKNGGYTITSKVLTT